MVAHRYQYIFSIYICKIFILKATHKLFKKMFFLIFKIFTEAVFILLY